MKSSHPPGLDATVLAVEGELNALTSPALRERIAEALDDGARAIAIDLTHVRFMDSSGLGVLVGGLKSARLHGGNLVLAGPGEQVRTLFEITQADRLFAILGTVDEALAYLAP
jgi:anti-sigma B factor antagonist